MRLPGSKLSTLCLLLEDVKSDLKPLWCWQRSVLCSTVPITPQLGFSLFPLSCCLVSIMLWVSLLTNASSLRVYIFFSCWYLWFIAICIKAAAIHFPTILEPRSVDSKSPQSCSLLWLLSFHCWSHILPLSWHMRPRSVYSLHFMQPNQSC